MDALAKAEADKYTKVWQLADYGNYSPGLSMLDTFFAKCPVQPLCSVVDFGCGSGRASLQMVKRGLRVLMIDIASNCLSADVEHRSEYEPDLQFLEACLWNLPADIPQHDWVYCCDVMEHIPPERIDAVLANVARLCKVGAFFQIACYPDSFGAAIGEPLHLTVLPPDWWRELMKKYFHVVADLSDERNAVFHVRPLQTCQSQN